MQSVLLRRSTVLSTWACRNTFCINAGKLISNFSFAHLCSSWNNSTVELRRRWIVQTSALHWRQDISASTAEQRIQAWLPSFVIILFSSIVPRIAPLKKKKKKRKKKEQQYRDCLVNWTKSHPPLCFWAVNYKENHFKWTRWLMYRFTKCHVSKIKQGSWPLYIYLWQVSKRITNVL